MQVRKDRIRYQMSMAQSRGTGSIGWMQRHDNAVTEPVSLVETAQRAARPRQLSAEAFVPISPECAWSRGPEPRPSRGAAA